MELGRYRLLAELARGGMGVVHLAEARGPGGFEKLVVVKELRRELADDPMYCAMFLEEARLAARLSHRHIVQTNEVACENGRYFMVLELLEGGSLHQIRSRLGVRALPLHMGVRVLAAVLEALHHAHELTDAEGQYLGVVHRDLSPQNVFLTFDGDVKLIDFGVAKSKDRRGEVAITRVGVVKGSVPYMSPDHVDGGTIDRRADVFAVGVLLREMLVGERLWGDADDFTILRSLIARDLPAFPDCLDVPPQLRAIAERAMSPKRADRFESAAAMRSALEAYLAKVDPRGSLGDLGAWLGEKLASERAAFRALVRRSRAQNAAASTKGTTSPATPVAARAPKGSDVWLPSCELRTRYSAPPLLPAAPPPMPSVVRRLARRARSSRLRKLAASVAFAGAVAFAALSLSHSRATTADPAAGATPASAALVSTHGNRTPRTVEGAVTVSIDTSATAERPLASDIAAALATDITSETAHSDGEADPPSSVLHEAVPPNPYDPN